MKRFLFGTAVAVLIVSGFGFFLVAEVLPLFGLFFLAAGSLSFIYLSGVARKSWDSKAAELQQQLEPIPQPSYTPKLFGVPMEWDPETGLWWAEFGCIDVDLCELELPGCRGFTWHIESLSDTGIETLEEAVAGIEEELTLIRNAIPYVAKDWQLENA
jgi:hypothetical protein